MTLQLILPWFPIVLSAAVGGRLVGRSRSTWLGFACAIFWIVVVQTATGPAIFANLSALASLLTGSVAIVGMAVWSANIEHNESTESKAYTSVARVPRPEEHHADPSEEKSAVYDRRKDRPIGDGADAVVALIVQFDEWLETSRDCDDPWPLFGEFVRNILYAHCGATHVRPYRILSEGDALVPLRTIDPADREGFKSARQGIQGHVATHGKTYVVDDPSQGELVRKLARVSDDVPVWCFVIRQGPRRIGLVAVQGWNGSQPDRALLNSMELLTNQFWSTLTEVCRSRTADRMDSPTRTLTRESFLEEAEDLAQKSYAAGEPVALVVFALEGLRALADNGRWDLATDVIRETSKILRNRLRPDDVLGRFDDSRFVLLLRRVDSALGSLIAGQLVSKLSASPLTVALHEYNGGIRCGIVGSGGASPPVSELVTRSVRLCHEARLNDLCVASDVADEDRQSRGHDRLPEEVAS